jgi:hypothetical protein
MPSWTIVKVLQLNNLSGNVVQTILTPASTGMFRATVYGQFVTLSTLDVLCPTLLYTNGLAPQQYLSPTTCEEFGGASVDFNWVVPFQPIGGSAVTLDTNEGGANFLYNYQITIEQLEANP